MSRTRHGQTKKPGLSRALCVFCATHLHFAATLAHAGSQTDTTAIMGEDLTASVDVIPSSPRIALIASALKTSTKFPTGLIPSAPRTSSIIPSEFPDRAFPTGLIPSAPRSSSSVITKTEPSLAAPSTTIPEGASSSPTTSTQANTGLIPSEPIISTAQSTTLATFPSLIPSYSTPINGTHVVPTISPTGMTSTSEGLHPIPPPTTNPGDPDGHHEISEPNFTSTLPCRGCSPVVEITATGWGTVPTFPVSLPPAQEVDTKSSSPPAATVPVGASNVVVQPQPSGSDFVIGGSTVKPGQTITVGGSPIAVHTSNGHTNVVIGGTQTMPLQTSYNPPAATVTVGGSLVVVKPAASGGAIIVGDSTVTPGQTITLSGTPVAVQTDGSHTQVVVAGTLTVPVPSPDVSPDAQITDAPIALPISLSNGATITPMVPKSGDSSAVNPTGYILSSQSLLPGGVPVVIEGTTYSLDADATVLAINNQTTTLHAAWGTLSTTVAAAPLTLWDHVYTANRAGYYILGPGTTLVPGGPAVTVSGSTLSLEAHGTAAVIQGSTSAMQPVTTVVTLTRSNSEGSAQETGQGTPLPTVGKHNDGSRAGVWFEGMAMLGFLVVSWFGVWP